MLPDSPVEKLVRHHLKCYYCIKISSGGMAILHGSEAPTLPISRQKHKHFARREKVNGQFLTPKEVAEFIVRLVSKETEHGVGIDPSCGDGVFLNELLKAGFREVIGIDLDSEVLKDIPSEIKRKAIVLKGDGLKFVGSGNAIVGNPPFSAKYGRITDQEILKSFELGKGRKSQAIEILFLEKFLQLASPGGVVGIILPQGIFSGIPMRYVREFILEHSGVLAVVSLPRNIFSNNTTSKTSILFVQKDRRDTKTFMAIADTLHDLPVLLKAYFSSRTPDEPKAFWTDLNAESFDPTVYLTRQKKHAFRKGLPVKLLGEIAEMRTGAAEYGPKRNFSSWGIPFITAKTVTSLGLDLSKSPGYIEPGSPMDKRRAYVGPGDILFVRVGVGCSGRAAVVPSDLSKGIADDWIYIIRTKEINPFYLALFFQTKFGQSQINSMKRGTGTVTIPQRILKNMSVPIMPVSFQEAVEARYKEIMLLREAGCLDEARGELDSLLTDIETETGE